MSNEPSNNQGDGIDMANLSLISRLQMKYMHSMECEQVYSWRLRQVQLIVMLAYSLINVTLKYIENCN